MKKILICINNMNMGGIQKSLVELLKQINEQYDITLFCIKSGGELISLVPSNIKIVYATKILRTSELSINEAFHESIHSCFFRIVGSGISKWISKKIPAYLATRVFQPYLGEFDAAISFSQPIEEHQFYMLSNEVVLYSCSAPIKISFLHCDYLNYGGNTKYNKKIYMKFDKVAAVSDSVKKRFVETIPEMSNKVFTVYNCHDYEKIRSLAEENSVIYENKAIVSIARLTKEKGLTRTVEIISRLINEGYDISWHIIGGGPLKQELQQLIKKYNLNNRIFLHGEQINPYKYLKNAFLLLVPSFHEAAPMVFEEAHALNIPILTTNTLSAKELVENKKIGYVCGNTNKEIYDKLKEIISADIDLVTKDERCDNNEQCNQFKKLIGE